MADLCFYGPMVTLKSRLLQHSIFYGISGFVFLNLMLFGDILFNGQGRVLSSPRADLYLHFVAWRQFAFQELLRGHLTLWNPHYLCGAPFFGNFESALLYPPNWLYLFLPLTVALNLGIVLHVFFAGFFTYLWALHRKLHPLAAFVAGTVFMWGGAYFLHVFAGHLPNLCTMVWAPLIFLAIDGLLEKFSLYWMLLGVFAVSMQILAGHPQYVYFTAIVSGIYVFLNLKGRKNKKKILINIFGIYAGACLITAVQLWTGIQALLECGRNIPLDYRSAASFSFPPENLLTLILPEFFGNLTTSPYWGRWFLWEVSLFIGVTASFLVFTAVVWVNAIKRRWALTTSTIAFIFSMGAFTPLFHVFYSFIPGFDGLRGICKFDFLGNLFLALLVGMGLDFLIEQKKKGFSLLWKIPLGLGTLLGVLGGLIFISAQSGVRGSWGSWFSSIGWLRQTFLSLGVEQKEDYLRQCGLHASYSLWVAAGTSFLLAFLLTLLKKNQKWIYAIVALSLIELFFFARSNRPTFEIASLEKKFDQIRALYHRDPGDYRVYGTASASLVTGGCDIWEDEPMVLGRYGRFVCYSQGLAENQLFSVLPIFRRFHPSFGMMRLKYRVFADQDPVQYRLFPFKILPRMLLVDQWEVIQEGRQILPRLFEPGFNPSRKVYLEKDPGLNFTPGKVRGAISWRDLSTDEVLIDADTSKDSMLLITDNYSQGWRTEGLSEPGLLHYEVMPANYFLMAIPLKAGKHHFILNYLPSAFSIGKWVSLLSTLLYVGILLAALRRKRLGKKIAL